MALGLFSGFIYSPPVPTKPGYDLPAAPAEGSGEGQAKSAAPAEPLPVLLAKADVGKGQSFAKACGACHNFEKGAGRQGRAAALWRRGPRGRLGARVQLFGRA